MGWELTLICIFGALCLLLATGIPVAFAFMAVVVIGNIIYMGFTHGPYQFLMSIYTSVGNFSMAPIPMFILMGDLLLRSGMAMRVINGLGKWFGAIPARLSLLSIIGGAFFGAISGSTVASTAIFGSLLLPEMRRAGYHNNLSMGPILAAGGLAMIIPPSALAVVYAATAEISVGKVLIAGFLPGLLMALNYIIVVFIQLLLDRTKAPAREDVKFNLGEAIRALFADILPTAAIVAAMVIFIYGGICTPSEAAAVGLVGSIVLIFIYRKMTWKIFYDSMMSALTTTGMILLIAASSCGFSYLMAYTGASNGLLNWVISLDMPPLALVAAMLLVVLIMGCFMDQVAIMMLTIPIFVPIVQALELNLVWFALINLVALEVGMKTPPFGMELFVMKSVTPETPTKDIYKTIAPFLVGDVVAIALILFFPVIALYLPNLMGGK